MNYLLDVNVLLAWGWADHAEHQRAASWIAAEKASRGVKLLTSSIPELGFVRISVQRTAGQLSVAVAAQALAQLLASLGHRHEFIPDDLSSTSAWPAWCGAASKTTDSHLLTLASKHGAHLATLDSGIPGALLIPHP